jgi:hypothetical protein
MPDDVGAATVMEMMALIRCAGDAAAGISSLDVAQQHSLAEATSAITAIVTNGAARIACQWSMAIVLADGQDAGDAQETQLEIKMQTIDVEKYEEGLELARSIVAVQEEWINNILPAMPSAQPPESAMAMIKPFVTAASACRQLLLGGEYHKGFTKARDQAVISFGKTIFAIIEDWSPAKKHKSSSSSSSCSSSSRNKHKTTKLNKTN